MNIINKTPRFAWEVTWLLDKPIHLRCKAVGGSRRWPSTRSYQKIICKYLLYTIIGHGFGILLGWQYHVARWKLNHRLCVPPEHATVGCTHKNDMLYKTGMRICNPNKCQNACYLWDFSDVIYKPVLTILRNLFTSYVPKCIAMLVFPI